jgi:hypothetical protein
MKRGRRDSVAFTVVVAALVLLGAVVMAVVVALSGAPGSLALAALLAAVPVGPLVGCFMWLDRYEPEPRNLLVAGLLWGAFAATGAAIVFQGLGLAGGATERDVLSVVAPVTEEVTKGAFLFLLLWWRRHELDGVLELAGGIHLSTIAHRPSVRPESGKPTLPSGHRRACSYAEPSRFARRPASHKGPSLLSPRGESSQSGTSRAARAVC